MQRHGGVDTTHAVLRSGLPSSFVPHIADQFFWAELLQRLGIAAEPLRAANFDTRRIQSRLEAVAANPDMVTRAQALSHMLRGESSAQRACESREQIPL